MFEALLESIKGERKLSMNHWRYRLLHWFFCVVPAPKTIEESPLHKSFYTHYCPLFHLTNLIAIFSPIIFTFRLVFAFFALFGNVVIGCFEYLENKRLRFVTAWNTRFPAKEKKKKKSEPEQQTTAQIEWLKDREENFIIKRMMGLNYRCFDSFWGDPAVFYVIRYNTMSEAKEIWNKYEGKVKAAQERTKIRNEWMRKKILFWINFSQIFVKTLLYVSYVALACFVAYVTVAYIIPMLLWLGKGAIVILWEMLKVDWLKIGGASAQFAGYWGLRAAALGVVFLIVFKIGSRLFRYVKLGWFFRFIAPPFTLMGDIADAFRRHTLALLEGILQFVIMFYEENCPAVKIVDDKEAVIEEEV